MRTRNGDYRWILDRARIVSRDTDGRPLRMSGTHEDITERKQIEVQLRQSEERFRLMATHALDNIWTMGSDYRFRYLNPSILSLSGYTEEQYKSLPLKHFKAINDTHGHLVGDEVLVELIQRVRPHLRTGDVLARWGGEEFVVLLPLTRCEDAANLAEKLRRLIAGEPFHTVGRVTSSFGVAEFLPDETSHLWLTRADDAL